ncbi:hypothetical protein J3458_016499 [Metarhizium acridum]|uniref:uncharacterized protein n=1 Tax=Metarhizium acridum TaxID=92637 RepID=UPI001C6BD4CD|nr:hypothetical protein J3458_016499 [Metarhizium acridum]
MPNTDDAPVAPSIDNLSNKFRGLAVYEPSEEFLNAPDVERPTRAKNDPNTYEAEAPFSLEDAFFALVAILNDMDRMRSRVKWIWSNYRAGLFDVTSAAIATNTAIELVRGMMDDVLPIFDTHGGYHRMLQKFYVFQCLDEGFAVEDLFGEKNGKDNFNYDTYNIAESVYLMAYRYLEAFAAILEPNQVPIYKDGIYGTYDPSSDRSTKTGLAKFQDDRALVMPYFSELMTIVMGVPNWPIEDEFLRGMEQIHRTKKIPFYSVFATQVFLDISYTLGEDVDSAYHTMSTHINFISNDIEQHFSFHKDLKIVNWPESNDRVLRNVRTSIEWLAEDPLLRVQNKLYQRMGWGSRLGAGHRLFRMSPVISGLTLYFFRSQYHEIGLSLADAWGSLQYCEHLYNAAQQRGHLSKRWADMDVVKALLDTDSFYVGSETPRTPDEQFKKFCLQIGVSAAALSKDRRKGKRVASKAGPRGIKPNAPVHYMFAPRYREKVAFSITAEQLDQIIDLSMYEKEFDEEGGLLLGQIEDSKKVKEKKRLREQYNKGIRRKGTTGGSRMAAEHMIELLAFALHAETVEFSFPYAQMHRWCWRLLRAVKEACDPLLRQIYGPDYLENETELPFIVGYVLLLASGADGEKQTMQPLEEAARALEGMVEPAGDFVTKKILGEILNIPISIINSDN